MALTAAGTLPLQKETTDRRRGHMGFADRFKKPMFRGDPDDTGQTTNIGGVMGMGAGSREEINPPMMDVKRPRALTPPSASGLSHAEDVMIPHGPSDSYRSLVDIAKGRSPSKPTYGKKSAGSDQPKRKTIGQRIAEKE